jgi:pyruvate/2-oxoglutarate/acetoin dehydrogenase E1 component/TPP-dependent pyruvate/acetoin dehydrogenase alpha subunit
MDSGKINKQNLLSIDKEVVINDYYIAFLSRQLSILGRKEVHTGRAHFGIFGDGKELAQVAYAKYFQNGDWRSGYYRDQTFMLASGLLNPEEFFAQIYGDTDIENNPSTGGRNFNNHHATRNFGDESGLINLLGQKNSSSDVSSTAGQMPRLLGLAHASKLVRDNPELQQYTKNTITGNEVAFGTIGESGTSEGMFFETINAACVLQVPLAVAIWDDGYGISVPVELQTAKGSISKALKGFETNGNDRGCKIFVCPGHDYPALVQTFEQGIKICRENHIPVIFHINELTQPLGHSTSGSHERYKSEDRLEWEKEHDPIFKFREWILNEDIADQKTINSIENKAVERARLAKGLAWESFNQSFNKEKIALKELIASITEENASFQTVVAESLEEVLSSPFPTRKKLLSFAKSQLRYLSGSDNFQKGKHDLSEWVKKIEEKGQNKYNTYIFSDIDNFDSSYDLKPVYTADSKSVSANEVLNLNFELLFGKYPLLLTFGEDTGRLGDVNQGMKGMQEKFGLHRVFDTGIRETTIIGQGIGLALRGFRPIAEIQYLDYLIYALPTISDDLATLYYRTSGQQIAPLIIRTRGHQLQGMWHSGSPMGMLLGSLGGVNICVPRNMTQAAGFYNTLLKGHGPALVIEPLKGYYIHEILPENLGEFTVPLGVPEILEEGTDITIVTYGWNVTIAHSAVNKLKTLNISVELIDVQTLVPFDIRQLICRSVQKTNKILFLDEDVPGGGTAYMMQKVLEGQKAFDYLDAPPKTLSAKIHRGAYGTDGEYFSKPNTETVIEAVYEIMHNANPAKYPVLYD